MVAGAVVVAGSVAACSSSGTTAQAPVETSDAAPPDAPTAGLTTADVPVGGGVILDESKIVVVQPSEGVIAAYTAVCPHQGCLVSSVADNEIICACHDSRFSSTDGSVISGPAQQGLAEAAVSVDGDSITAG
jgi:Rieske Fe-S protein